MCAGSGQMKAKAKKKFVISSVQDLYSICALASKVNQSYWKKEL